MVPAVAGALIGAGTELVNGLFQSGQNRKNREFAEKMYAQQRNDALADREFENNYNSPAAQMARLEAAGLNPNMVYGQGQAVGNSTNTRSSSPPSYRGEAPKINTQGIINSAMAFYDKEQKQAQTDNIKANTQTAVQDALLKVAQTAQTTANTARTGTNTAMDNLRLNQAMQLNDNTMATAYQQLEKLKADTQFTSESNTRANKLNGTQIASILENIKASEAGRSLVPAQLAKINVEIENLKKTGGLQDLDTVLRRNGINPNDPFWIRVLGQWTKDFKIPTLKSLRDGFVNPDSTEIEKAWKNRNIPGMR